MNTFDGCNIRILIDVFSYMSHFGAIRDNVSVYKGREQSIAGL